MFAASGYRKCAIRFFNHYTMSDHPNHSKSAQDYICPNCQHLANGNYCPQCGQETHLHKDTFLGLLSHFVAHYFHYDSKFWNTLKALVVSPGKLTIAYREKKRQRYIPPISLYIFVSIVFFLLFSVFQKSVINVKVSSGKDSIALQQNVEHKRHITEILEKNAKKENRSLSTFEKINGKMGDGVMNELGKSPEIFKEKLVHTFPKIFFFMIPFMALILKLFFVRDKRLYFVDHAVFALHMHSFIFVLSLIALVNPFEGIQDSVSMITMAICIVYMIIALRRVYKRSWGLSVLIGLSTTALYFICLFLVLFLDLYILFGAH